MTIATTTTAEFSINQIATLAYRQAGLLPLQQLMDEERGRHARDLLELEVKHLQAKGLFARSTDFYDLSLVADTERYTLPTNVLDVEGNGMYMPASVTDTTRAPAETIVTRIGQEQWHELSAKNATGIPLQMYVHRVATLQLRFWPIPVEAGTVRIRVHRLFADVNTNGNATVDLERPWQQYLVYTLAHELAISASLPLERVVVLQRKAAELFRECKGFANESTGTYVYNAHRGRR